MRSFMLRARTLALAMLLIAPCVRADIYQWTDERGQVHFGDRKLETVKQTKLSINTAHSEWQRYAIAVEAIDVELSESERARIVDDVNNVYRFFDDVLFFDMYKTVPVSIRIYPNAKAYYDYLKTVVSGNITPSWGVYLQQNNSIVVYIQPQRAATFETIKHETGHAIVATITPFTTAWLNEGLAEQMETLTLENARLSVARNAENSHFVQQLRTQAGGLLGLDKLFALRSDQWRSHHTDSGIPLQCQTGELIYFLLASPPGRNFIVRMLHRYERGTMELSNTLVEQDYLGGIPAMQADWNRWLLEGGATRIDL
jgi:hypothetical protein